MGTLRNFVLRGLYAAITLSFLIALYLTVSRGGIGSLGIGLIVLLVLGSGRLRMLADLLLLSLPGAWLWWQMQSLPGLLGTGVLRQQKIDDGILFRNDLILALLVAFALQAAYAFLANRYELASGAKRWLGILVVAGGVIAVVLGALVVANMYGGPEQAYAALVGNANETENVGQRLVSLDISSRGDYWMVAWEAWKERPFTGTGAGTFQYTWLEDRPGFKGVPNTTTPDDVLLMLEKIADPSYTTPDLSAEMLEVMTNTSFEDRLPQPLPEGTRVSHKIGYYGTTYADAGVVFPEGARDATDAYFMVVMASETSELASQAATQEMSLATYRILSEPDGKKEGS
jgi:hypothetical protein